MWVTRPRWRGAAFSFAFALTCAVAATLAQEEDCENCIINPTVIPELPIEVETEVGPAGSLKLIPLWKEIRELLEEPYSMTCPEDDPSTTIFDESSECVATTDRRPGFGNEMPPLKVFNPCFNVLTGQPLRLRPDGEIDWNQPGPLFDPDEVVPVVGPNDPTPTALRTIIGYLVVDEENNLVVANPGPDVGDEGTPDPRIPPDGTVVAEPACDDEGRIVEDGVVVTELEQPVNETHFLREATDTRGLTRKLRDLYLGNDGKKKGKGKRKGKGNRASTGESTGGRLWSEILGKSLFWDMQVGSDGVQACGSCHFHAGADNRTRNQLNSGTNQSPTPDGMLDFKGPNEDVVAADFPFHERDNPDVVGDGTDPSIQVSDSNDVMSSMGVSEFKEFVDVIVGDGAFGPAFMGVAPLRPDLGEPLPEPIPSLVDENGNKLRRIEPRNTPTFHSAAFNFDNFWDGRARHDFNGGSTFGPSDPFFHIYVNCDGVGADELRELAAPEEAEGPLCDWTEMGGNYLGADEGEDPVPVRIRFSSLASQAVQPPLTLEMAFEGRNWAKIGKKLLQAHVTPLANQLVHVEDSRLGPYSNQGGSACDTLERPTAPGKPGLCLDYRELIRLAFPPELWGNDNQHLNGTSVPKNNDCDPGDQIHELDIPPTCDPFDGYVLSLADGTAAELDTGQFNQMEANFSFFFGMSIQTYEQLTIPDDTPWDRFNDANPRLGFGVGQPGEQGTLHPSIIRELVTGAADGELVFPDPDEFGPEELFGFDIFAGGNITAALPVGSDFNPDGVGANPFLRTSRCMLCHLGPEQTDHTNNVNAGLLQSGTEMEFPVPPTAPEATGVLRLVTGISLAEELEENAQDGVEVENRNFAVLDDFETPFDEAQIANARGIAFQDNGVYNIGVRPTNEDLMRGEDDPFGWPKSLAALALKNLGGVNFEPCDTLTEASEHPNGCKMTNFDPSQGKGGGLFETVGEGFPFPGTSYEQESINPGLDLEPADPLLPEYLAEWANNLPAGELHPLIDELAFAPNTVTPHNPESDVAGTLAAEYGEILFGSDVHCGLFDPNTFGDGPPNFGWGPRCPNAQSAVPGNFDEPLNGTFPFVNRVARDGAVKVPQLRNVELTGPYFHSGSYLTLRQVIDFYMRGGDFPFTNAEVRDPDLVDIDKQAFGFGATIGLPPQFQDGVPDVLSRYSEMPCTGEEEGAEQCAATPEFLTPEDAKVALVKFLLALTDERVAFRRAPFDQPEIFPPIDGRAPENAFGRQGLLDRSGVSCLEEIDGEGFSGICFQQVPATGAGGQATRLPNFLGVSSTPLGGNVDCASSGGLHCDHFDRQ